MARVPYTGLDALAPPGTIGVSGGYNTTQASPEAFGGGVGAAAEKLGTAAQQAGGAALDFAAQQQSLHNQVTVTNNMSVLRNKITATSWGDPNDPNAPQGYLTLTGSDALNGYEAAFASAKKAQSDLRAGLSPPQQIMFDRASLPMVDDANQRFAAHQAQQRKTYASQSFDASARSAQSAAIAAPVDSEEFKHSLADGRYAILNKASVSGWSPEVTTQQLAEYTSGTFRAATERLKDVSPQAAWSYYQARQSLFTGQDRLALETQLRPALLDWGARNDAARLYNGGTSGGIPSGPLPEMIRQSAAKQGIDPADALTVARLESAIGTAPDRPGSQFRGPFQMGDAAWSARGGTAANRNDPAAQVDFGVANLAHSRDVAQQALGQSPKGWQMYLVHQQGDAGGPALLKAPAGQNAIEALAPAYGGDNAKARAAITANGGTAATTAGDFRDLWQAKYQAAGLGLGGTGVPSAQKPVVFGDSIADGVQRTNNTDGWGIKSASPRDILGRIATDITPTQINGRNVVLSTGMSNAPDPKNLAVVQEQVDNLKRLGAARITILGVGHRPDLAPLNGPLQALAEKNGATFQPIQAGPDKVHPSDYRGVGLAGLGVAQASAGGSSAAAARPNFPAIMQAADGLLDPFGQSNPVYIDHVKSRLRAMQNEAQYADSQAEKSNRETLLGFAIGIPGTAPGIAGTLQPQPGQTAPIPARPTSLDQLFQNPAAKSAWAAATPETQRSIMQLIEHNARNVDPPMSPAAQTLYYQLSGMATNDREAFQKLDLSDPQYTSALPHSYWNILATEQRRFGTADVARAAREETQSRALTILKPDLLAAGFKTEGLKPGTTAAQTYDTFVGRLRESLDHFQQDNKRRPTDNEVAKLGKSLLLQGTERGTASSILPSFLGGGERAVRAFQTDPARFAPTVPPADRDGIVSSYKARHGGQAPTDGEISEIWMLGRQQAMQPRRPGAQPRPNTPMPPAPVLPMAQTDTPSAPISPAPSAAPTPATPQPATSAPEPAFLN